MAQSAKSKKTANAASAGTCWNVYGIRETKNDNFLSLSCVKGDGDNKEFVNVLINKKKAHAEKYVAKDKKTYIKIYIPLLIPQEKASEMKEDATESELPF